MAPVAKNGTPNPPSGNRTLEPDSSRVRFPAGSLGVPFFATGSGWS